MFNLVRKPAQALAPVLLIATAWVFVFGVGGASSRVMQSYHGLHHSAYVYQIANGLIPPTNPSSLEMPANFYWLWHAGLALGVSTFGVTPFEMSLVSNALGLSGFLLGLWWVLGAVIKRPALRLIACGLPFFVLNPLGLIQFGGRLASVWVPEVLSGNVPADVGLLEHLISIARHHSSLQMVDHSLAQLFPRVGFEETAMLSDRAGHLINKFLNFNSFPLALAFFAGAQALLIRAPGGLITRSVALGFVTFCMALVSPLPVVAFGMTVVAFLVVEGMRLRAATSNETPNAMREGMPAILWPAVGSAVGVACALPFILPVASAYQGTFVVLGPSTGLFRHAVALGWPLVPTFVLLLLGHWLRLEMSEEAKVLAMSAIFYATAALFFVTPREDPNEYKLVLLCAFPSSLLAVEIGRALWSRIEVASAAAKRIETAAIVGLAVMTALSVSIMTLLYLASPWTTAEPLRFEGTVTTLQSTSDAKLRDLDDAYAWLRTSTPASAIVLAEPTSKDVDLLPVVAQRRVVSQLASPFTHAIAHQERLIEANRTVVHAVARCRLGESELDTLRSLPLSWSDEIFILVERLPGAAVCSRASNSSVALEFANRSFAVYRLSALAGLSDRNAVP